MRVVGVFLWLFCGFGCQWLANRKGYGHWAAFLVGFLGGPLGLLIYAGAPDLKARRAANAVGALIAAQLASLSGKDLQLPSDDDDGGGASDGGA